MITMPHKPVKPGIDRRHQLLETALSIFAERGYEAATTKEITERTGVNQGLLYFYFKSKADLFFEVFRHYGQLVQAQLDTIFDQEQNEDLVIDMQRLFQQIITVLNTSTARDLMLILHQVASSRGPEGLPHMLHQVANSRIPEGFPPGGFPHDRAEQPPFRPLIPHLNYRLTVYLDSQLAHGKLQTVKTDLVAAWIIRALISPFVNRNQNAQNQPTSQEQAAMIARLFCYGLLPRENHPDKP
jgi:AcrR family transcriptional regulator